MMPKPIKFDEYCPSDLLFDRGKLKSPPRAGVPNIMAHMSVWHEDEAAPRTRV